KPVIELRWKRHVALVARPIRRLRDGGSAPATDHVVAAKERRRQALHDRIAPPSTRCAIRLELRDLRLDVPLFGGELFGQALLLAFRALDLAPHRGRLAFDALNLFLAISNELSQLLELALCSL